MIRVKCFRKLIQVAEKLVEEFKEDEIYDDFEDFLIVKGYYVAWKHFNAEISERSLYDYVETLKQLCELLGSCHKMTDVDREVTT